MNEHWAIVELMGHVRLAGRLSEVEHFGSKMGKLDIPSIEGDGFITQLFGGGSVYRITYVTERVARHVARSSQPQPVSPWDFPKQLTQSGDWPDHAEVCAGCGNESCTCDEAVEDEEDDELPFYTDR